jgi:putative salt-induced outer membrane protein YdiY
MLRKLIIPTFIALLIAQSGYADEIRMKNGSRLIGELISIESDKVIFSTPFAGKITITQDNVDRIITETPVTLKMQDGTVYEDRQIIATEKAMLVEAEDEAPVIFDTTDIEMVNPEPWKLGIGYDWSGRFSLAAEAERGNSDSDEWDLKAESVWLSLKDRYTLKGNMEFEESRGVKTEDNWYLFSKYDRFLEPGSQNYRGAKLSFEYDKFEDIDLRTVLGPHFGRQFAKSERFKLEMELGPVWVHEQYSDDSNEDWAGALWFIDASTDIIGFGSTLYLDHDGILKVEEPSETILNAVIGIRFPIVGGFETAFEVEYEYDGGAVDGIDKLDTTYNLRLGYAW